MAFTTYAALLSEALDDLSSGSWRMKSYSKGNHSVSYRSLSEFLDYIQWLRVEADIEAGSAHGRTYLRPMGRDDRD